MKSVLLVGATGFLGSHLLKSFLDQKYLITATCRTNTNFKKIENYLDAVVLYNIDSKPLDNLFAKNYFNFVVNCACDYGRDNIGGVKSVFLTNLNLAIELLDLSETHSVEKFVSIGTSLPGRLNPYSFSKETFSHYMEYFHEDIVKCDVRFDHMYGNADDQSKFVRWLITQISSNKVIELTEGNQLRNFIHVSDVVSAINLLLSYDQLENGYHRFDLMTEKMITVRKFCEEVLHAYENVNGVSQAVFEFGKLPYRKHEPMAPKLNANSIRKLGWKATKKLSEGLREICIEA